MDNTSYRIKVFAKIKDRTEQEEEFDYSSGRIDPLAIERELGIIEQLASNTPLLVKIKETALKESLHAYLGGNRRKKESKGTAISPRRPNGNIDWEKVHSQHIKSINENHIPPNTIRLLLKNQLTTTSLCEKGRQRFSDINNLKWGQTIFEYI